MKEPIKVIEKRRLFLPPDPPKEGPRCEGEGLLGLRCLRTAGHDGGHFICLEEGQKYVVIRGEC